MTQRLRARNVDPELISEWEALAPAKHGELRLRVDNLYYLMYLNVVKHLFKYTILEGLAKAKKELVRAYLKVAGNCSYDAANLEEYPALRSMPDS